MGAAHGARPGVREAVMDAVAARQPQTRPAKCIPGPCEAGDCCHDLYTAERSLLGRKRTLETKKTKHTSLKEIIKSIFFGARDLLL